MKKKILISTGGSGGHVIPALNFYDHLKENFDVYLTTDLRGSRFIDTKIYKRDIIHVPDLKKNLFKFPFNLIFFFISIFKSLVYLRKNNIYGIISTGGYVTVPICIASRLTSSKLFLFEPNMVLGRSNLLFIKQCKKIFCYHKNIERFPQKFIDKIQHIQPMLKKKSYSIKSKIKDYSEKRALLIIGGSQGANFFQTELKEIICKLSKKFNLSVYHQTNRENFEALKAFYENKKIPFNLFDFDHSLENIFKKTYFCITRAGASTLAELVYFEIPFLAIPFPFSKDNHQLFNAQFYKKHNCCWLIEQKDILEENLFEIISNILINKKDIHLKKNAMLNFSLENTWNNNNKLLMKTLDDN